MVNREIRGVLPWAAVALAVGMASCATVSFNDSLGAAYLTADWVANTSRELCGNVEPGGPCAPGAILSSEQMDKARAGVGDALQALDAARQFKLEGDEASAKSELAAARATLGRLRQWLEGVQ